LQLIECHVAAWRRHARLDVAILGVRDFHARSIAESWLLVLGN
jgi:hypothetical protein